MTNTTLMGLFLVMLTMGLAGCGHSVTEPSEVGPSDRIAAPADVPQLSVSPINVPPLDVPPPDATGAVRQLAGTVYDAAWRPIPAARVEVVDGPNIGLSTTANAKGEFRLTGAFDQTNRFRATQDGYVGATKAFPDDCPACNPHWWLHFYLESADPHPNLAGDYTLTFMANPSCANLPDEARTRTYEATATPAAASSEAAGSKFDVRISSPTLVPSFDGFSMGIVGDFLAFEIGDPGHSGAGLVQQVAPNRYVTLDGLVTTVVRDVSVIAAPLSGAVYICELPGVWNSPYNCGGPGGVGRAGCHSTNHQFVLRRRAR